MRHGYWVGLVLSGCVSVQQPLTREDERGVLPATTRPTYNLAGYPPEFKAGYVDGCETAKQSQWGWKDLNRFKADKQYRRGWEDGYQICAVSR